MKPMKPLKILVLGGTVFVGRHMVEAALARGHAVTLFNRGKHGADLFPGAARIVGDREADLAALAGGAWNWVLDTCGYTPGAVRKAVEALRGRAPRYAFVSTISVYGEAVAGMDETARLAEPQWGDAVTPGAYGPLKVACEQVVGEAYGDAALIVRPGIVAGPHDGTDRFTYWAERMAGSGEVVAPGPRDAWVQAIDARDLAAATIGLMEAGTAGVFNMAGEAMTREAFLRALGPAPVRWVDEAAIRAAGVEPGAFPFWTAPADAGIFAVSSARAAAAGLSRRPVGETARDTRAWLASEPRRALKVGIGREDEARLR